MIWVHEMQTKKTINNRSNLKVKKMRKEKVRQQEVDQKFLFHFSRRIGNYFFFGFVSLSCSSERTTQSILFYLLVKKIKTSLITPKTKCCAAFYHLPKEMPSRSGKTDAYIPFVQLPYSATKRSTLRLVFDRAITSAGFEFLGELLPRWFGFGLLDAPKCFFHTASKCGDRLLVIRASCKNLISFSRCSISFLMWRHFTARS